jgi:hypothetical protein
MGLPETFSRLLWTDAARAETNLGLLRASLPEELFSLLPTILGQVPDPDTALNNLERFIPSAGQRVLDGLQRTPVLLHYLLAFFSYSRYLTETLVRQPELILWIEREKFLTRLKSREDLLEGLARFEATALDSDPALTLARFKRREYLRIALKDILRLASFQYSPMFWWRKRYAMPEKNWSGVLAGLTLPTHREGRYGRGSRLCPWGSWAVTNLTTAPILTCCFSTTAKG